MTDKLSTDSTSLGTATLDVQPIIHPALTADVEQLAEAVDQAKAREILTVVEGRRYAIVTAPGQQLHEITVDPEAFADEPLRQRGKVTLADTDSFVTYVDRHSTEDATTLWGNREAGQIIAVFNDHSQVDETAGWGDHRAALALTRTSDWLHWLKNDGKLLDQNTFAEHIEDGVDAIRDPDAATMLEVAQTFHAKTGVNYNSSRRLSGEVEFAYEETATARAGQKGKLEVPQILTLGLSPFEGSPEYELKARIRFRLADGHLAIGYRLIRPDKVLRAAFDDVVRAVAGGCDLPVMAGTPRASG